MCKILIFGGTTEGRLLAEYCNKKRINAWVSVATDYGKMVLPQSRYLCVREAPMDACEMEEFIKRQGILLVLDATHPYAAEVSRNIRTACERTGIKLLRVVRKPEIADQRGEAKENILWVDSVEEAVHFLDGKTGNILVTTGSKELSLYTALKDFEERVYARVLPSASVISACGLLGIKGRHLIAMQGPFSSEMNRAMIKQYDIRYLVTKEAGSAGGFLEKTEAAGECKIMTVVIGRPTEENGISLEEAKAALRGCEALLPKTVPNIIPEKKKIFLIGTGMGGPDQMIGKAWKEMEACDVIFGAERLLSDFSEDVFPALKMPFYLSKDILPWLKEHEECRRIAVLYSGDTGFFSGAKKMTETLGQEPYCQEYDTVILPGISSVSYLCSRLKTGWEDVRPVSLHGRECDIAKEVRENSKVFALLDGVHTVNSICSLLKDSGFKNVRLSVGERLSYPEERITVGTPETLQHQKFDVLSAVLIER